MPTTNPQEAPTTMEPNATMLRTLQPNGPASAPWANAGDRVYARATSPGHMLVQVFDGVRLLHECHTNAAAVKLDRPDTTTAQGRWTAVAQAFESAKYGPLYADEYCTEPLWEMAVSSVDMSHGDPDNSNAAAVDAETASRVADAIALLAYGRDAVKAAV